MIASAILTLLLTLPAALGYLPIRWIGEDWLWGILAGLFLLGNLLPALLSRTGQGRDLTGRLRVCRHGVACLTSFAWSLPVVILYHLLILPPWPYWHGGVSWWDFLWSGLICFLAEVLLFWNGMICVYAASVQLGIRHRVPGLLCGMIPVLNLVMLRKIILTVREEVSFEGFCLRRDRARAHEQVCATRYPILMVHGVFFRDAKNKYLNYWGRIPDALEKNGAVVYFGNQPSAASVKDCGEFLAERIRAIVAETGCERVHIIAHSKGGLDARWAIAQCGVASMVASLTTINTPHRGCGFADVLLGKAPVSLRDRVAAAYHKALSALGEPNADFLAAVSDLTATRCAELDPALVIPAGEHIYCRGVGSVLTHATGGRFPLNMSYHLVKHFDGPNDGLVSASSYAWGEDFIQLVPPADRGISHGDMIDLNRENIRGFDVREFYVGLVSDLKARGL